MAKSKAGFTLLRRGVSWSARTNIEFIQLVGSRRGAHNTYNANPAYLNHAQSDVWPYLHYYWALGPWRSIDRPKASWLHDRYSWLPQGDTHPRWSPYGMLLHFVDVLKQASYTTSISFRHYLDICYYTTLLFSLQTNISLLNTKLHSPIDIFLQ